MDLNEARNKLNECIESANKYDARDFIKPSAKAIKNARYFVLLNMTIDTKSFAPMADGGIEIRFSNGHRLEMLNDGCIILIERIKSTYIGVSDSHRFTECESIYEAYAFLVNRSISHVQ